MLLHDISTACETIKKTRLLRKEKKRKEKPNKKKKIEETANAVKNFFLSCRIKGRDFG